jgi:hypothetical protein
MGEANILSVCKWHRKTLDCDLYSADELFFVASWDSGGSVRYAVVRSDTMVGGTINR